MRRRRGSDARDQDEGNRGMADGSGSSLAGIDLLSDLSAKELRSLEKSCRWKRYSFHEQIIDRQSDTSDVFFLVKGKVRVIIYSLSGREIALDDVVEGSYFGELAAIDGQPRSASVMAITDTLIASLPPETFMATLDRHSGTARKLMTRLTQIVRTATNRIMDLSTLGSNNRIHAELLRLAQAVHESGNIAVIKPIPVHGDMASRVSTTRETVARVMNDLARQGIVKRTKDAMIVEDIGRLQSMVEEVRGE